MPQMAPYNWFMMFLLFNFINLIIISINYYTNSPNYNFIFKFKLLNKFSLQW